MRKETLSALYNLTLAIETLSRRMARNPQLDQHKDDLSRVAVAGCELRAELEQEPINDTPTIKP